MNNTQLYLAIGVPSILALINLGVILVLFTDLSRRISSLEERLCIRIDALTGAVNELDKRLTRVEIKLNLQP
jgi:hypothetical protein